MNQDILPCVNLRKTVVPLLPDLDTCTDDELLDLAADALRSDGVLYTLCGSSDHVRAILKQIERLDLALQAAEQERDRNSRVIVEQQLELAAMRNGLVADSRQRTRSVIYGD